jgi:hypothetical protein
LPDVAGVGVASVPHPAITTIRTTALVVANNFDTFMPFLLWNLRLTQDIRSEKRVQ